MRNFLLAVAVLLAFCFFTNPANAQIKQPKEEYSKAQIIKIAEQGKVVNNGQSNLYQDLEVKIMDGAEKGKTVNVHYGDPETLTIEREVNQGDVVVLLKSSDSSGKVVYSIYDKYRFNNVILALIFFFILVIIIARLKGIGSIFGLLTSLAVILLFIVPLILKGADPLLVSVIGSCVILLVTTYVAHGVSKQTTVALFSTFISLLITVALTNLFTDLTKLSGVGNEDIASLATGATSIINLKGLFLGGIIIGTLGALNDITITQSATVFEIARTNIIVSYITLFKKSFNIGREHILSLVNTLVLAYAGSSLFIFIFLVLNPGHIPYWVILNTETISGEIISAIVGSSGLILAVPIVTLVASLAALGFKGKITKEK